MSKVDAVVGARLAQWWRQGGSGDESKVGAVVRVRLVQ